MTGEIMKVISEKKLKPSDCAYHTWRDLSNKDGAYTGKVRILVVRGESKARVEYICPHCLYSGYQEKTWEKPFSFDCQKCGKTIKIMKLREEFKKDQKKAQKAEERAAERARKK